jgi:hypothetical protein
MLITLPLWINGGTNVNMSYIAVNQLIKYNMRQNLIGK